MLCPTLGTFVSRCRPQSHRVTDRREFSTDFLALRCGVYVNYAEKHTRRNMYRIFMRFPVIMYGWFYLLLFLLKMDFANVLCVSRRLGYSDIFSTWWRNQCSDSFDTCSINLMVVELDTLSLKK